MRIRRRAFTLVEAVVAAAVGSLVLAGIYETLAAASRGLEKGEAGLAANLRLQRLLELLRTDLAGPWPWGPCNYPEEALRELGYQGGDRTAFALERRRIRRWMTPYRDHEGPTGPTQLPVAGPIREIDSMNPCKVRWACFDTGKPIWIGPGPSLAGTDSLRDAPPFAELVPLGRGDDAPWILVLGPALWSWNPTTRKLLRWDETDGAGDPGGGLVVELAVEPIDEWSVDYLSKGDPARPIVMRQKEMLTVRVGLARTEDRLPLVFETTLARGTGPAS